METIDIVKDVVKNEVNYDVNENTFIHELALDSLDEVELIMSIEEEFEIIFNDEELEKCKTVKDIVSLIEETKG